MVLVMGVTWSRLQERLCVVDVRCDCYEYTPTDPANDY